MTGRTERFTLTEIPISCSDPEELKKILQEAKIPVEQYGHGGKKSISKLAEEIGNKECFLKIIDGKVYREVHKAKVEVYITNPLTGKKYVLVEKFQVFENGSVRDRDNPFLGEKQTPREEPITAARRAIMEELIGDRNDLQEVIDLVNSENSFVLEGSDFKKEESDSFPGMKNIAYGTIYSIEFPGKFWWKVQGGFTEVQEEKTTLFRWKEISPES